MSQETYLLHTTVRENLRYAKPDATDSEIFDAAWAARVESSTHESQVRGNGRYASLAA